MAVDRNVFVFLYELALWRPRQGVPAGLGCTSSQPLITKVVLEVESPAACLALS